MSAIYHQRWCDLCDRDAVKKVLYKGTTVVPIMTSYFCEAHRAEMTDHADRVEGVVVDAGWSGTLSEAARLIIVGRVMQR